MRLIDADAVISKVEEVLNKGVYKTMIVELIRNAETIDYKNIVEETLNWRICFGILPEPNTHENQKKDERCKSWIISEIYGFRLVPWSRLIDKGLVAGYCPERIALAVGELADKGVLEVTADNRLRMTCGHVGNHGGPTAAECRKYLEDLRIRSRGYEE